MSDESNDNSLMLWYRTSVFIRVTNKREVSNNFLNVFVGNFLKSLVNVFGFSLFLPLSYVISFFLFVFLLFCCFFGYFVYSFTPCGMVEFTFFCAFVA